MKSKFCFFLLMFFSFITAMAQNHTVTGNVKSKNGETLQGVTVSVKGTNTFTTTDASGDYSIQVPSARSVLEFSYVGSTNQSVTVANKKVINVTLTVTASTLNDVVVVGYGTVKRKDLTGSVSI